MTQYSKLWKNERVLKAQKRFTINDLKLAKVAIYFLVVKKLAK